MSRTKIHHSVPKGVLRNFSVDGAGKQVWVFDKETKEPRLEALSTAGGERYFNQVVINGKGVTFEDLFDEVDAALPSLLAKIITAEQVSNLDSSDRDTLSLLAAIQFLRVKIIRDSAQAFPDQLRQSLEEAGLAEWAASIPPITDNDGRQIGLSLLADATRRAADLRGKELTLYKAPEGSPFWISDNPVVMANHFPFGDLGFAARGVEILWPISPRFLLSFRCPSIRHKIEGKNPANPEIAAFLASEPLLVCRPQDVDWFNTLQVHHSTRFLYSHSNEFSLALRLISKTAGTARAVLFSMSPLGTLPPKPRMPPGIHLIASGRKTEHMCPVASWEGENGGLRVRLPQEASSTAQALLADGPFQSAEIYDTEGPGTGMRDVVIELVSDAPIELFVSYHDAGLNDLAGRLDTRPAG